MRPGAVAQSPGREAALAWASLAPRFPASSVVAGMYMFVYILFIYIYLISLIMYLR